MGYLDWELERQRSALRMLLLGGGTRRDGEAVPDGERRSPAELRAVQSGAGGQGGRYAGGGYMTGFGDGEAWEAVREARQDRPGEEEGALEAPGGAWERVPDGKAGSPERKPAGGLPALRDTLREEAVPWAGRFPVPGAAAEPLAESPGRAGTKEPSATSSGGGESAGASAAVMPPARSGAVWVPRQNGRGSPWERGASAALQAEDSARALSQAVQRDARRYDGGFTIY